MKRCPKCNLRIADSTRKCPYCKVSLPKSFKDQIGKQPDIIKTPNKITNTESLEKTHEIKIKPIPLKVKPIKSPKRSQTPKKENNIQIKIFSSVKIVFVLLLLLINLAIIFKIVSDKEKQTISPEKSSSVEHPTTNSLGSWRSSNNGLFIFEDNNKFFWYEYYDDLKNNYYSGDYNYKQGLDALEEMGYTEEEFNLTFGEDIKIENVYSMNLLPTYSFKAGSDMTKEELSENENWWYIIMIRNDGTAIAYNKTLDLRYNLVKN